MRGSLCAAASIGSPQSRSTTGSCWHAAPLATIVPAREWTAPRPTWATAPHTSDGSHGWTASSALGGSVRAPARGVIPVLGTTEAPRRGWSASRRSCHCSKPVPASPVRGMGGTRVRVAPGADASHRLAGPRTRQPEMQRPSRPQPTRPAVPRGSPWPRYHRSAPGCGFAPARRRSARPQCHAGHHRPGPIDESHSTRT